MLWLCMVGALALEPTSADALMPVYVARMELAAAREKEAEAKQTLIDLKKRRSVIAQKKATATKLVAAAGENDAEAMKRVEEAAAAEVELKQATEDAAHAWEMSRVEKKMWDAIRKHEIAKNTLENTDLPADKINGLQSAVERAAARRAEATSAVVSLRATE